MTGHCDILTNMPDYLFISIVVPVYSSQQTLPDLTTRLGDTLPAMTDHYDVIRVNDGSHDESWGGDL
jgi:glycosyltransferase involved in cell wall biosynthesis